MKVIYPVDNPDINPIPYPNRMAFQYLKNSLFESSSSSFPTSSGGDTVFTHSFVKGNPHKAELLMYDSLLKVLNCPSRGISPLRWFFERFKTSRKVKLVTDME